MKAAIALTILGGLAGLGAGAGCPGPDDDTNPKTLWLGPQNSELDVQLLDDEPPPF